MDDFLIHLRAYLCLLAVAAALAGVAWYEDRHRDPADMRGWKPADAVVIGRTQVSLDAQEYARLTVGFRTWRGHPAMLVADIPSEQAPPTDRVWVLYDPLHPERAALSLHQPDEY